MIYTVILKWFMVQFGIQKNLKLKMYRNLSWVLCRPHFWVHERGKIKFNVCGHIKQFHYKRMLSKDSKATLHYLWSRDLYRKLIFAVRKVEVENKCTGIYHGFFEELIFRVHESEKLESNVCAHIKQFHYKRTVLLESKVTLYRLWQKKLYVKMIYTVILIKFMEPEWQ